MGLMRVVVLAVALLGCGGGAQGASLAQLHQRAAFDLGCNNLRLHHLDARTKIVGGCGHDAVYVEDCQHIRGADLCTWRADAQARPTMTPGATTYAPPPTVGRLSVRAIGGTCTVRINGQTVGATPVAANAVALGPAHVECLTLDGQNKIRDVHVKGDGNTTRVWFALGDGDLGY